MRRQKQATPPTFLIFPALLRQVKQKPSWRKIFLEQSKASNDISAHVEKVAQMTEENHAATEATADAANQLTLLADAMRTAVNRFKV